LPEGGVLVAVATWGTFPGATEVWMYRENSWGAWKVIRKIGPHVAFSGRLQFPEGLRITRDGSAICVVDGCSGRVCMFRVNDGTFMQHLGPSLYSFAHDVEEIEDGWLAACSAPARCVEIVGRAGGGLRGPQHLLDIGGLGTGEFDSPVGIVTVPGVGIVVRYEQHLQVFAPPDVIAMGSMAPSRVAWMVATARGIVRRSRSLL
jgi:hypothetical protein